MSMQLDKKKNLSGFTATNVYIILLNKSSVTFVILNAEKMVKIHFYQNNYVGKKV